MEEDSIPCDTDKKSHDDTSNPEKTTESIMTTPNNVVNNATEILIIFVSRTLVATVVDAIVVTIIWFKIGAWYGMYDMDTSWYSVFHVSLVLLLFSIELVIPYIRPVPHIHSVMFFRGTVIAIMLWSTIASIHMTGTVHTANTCVDSALKVLALTNGIVSIGVVIIVLGIVIATDILCFSDNYVSEWRKINIGTVIGIISGIFLATLLCVPLEYISSSTVYHAVRGAIPVLCIYHVFFMTVVHNANVTWRGFKGYIMVTGLQLSGFFVALVPVVFFVKPVFIGDCPRQCQLTTMFSGFLYCTITQIILSFICHKMSRGVKYIEHRD